MLKTVKKKFLFVVLVFAFLPAKHTTYSSNSSSGPQEKKREPLESVIAVVNGKILSRTQLDNKIRREMYLQGIIPSKPSSALRERYLKELIDDELLIQAAEGKKIEPMEEIVENFADRFTDHVKNLFPDENTYLQHIDDQYIDLVDFKKLVREWERRDYLMNALISSRFSILEDEVREYAQKLKSEGKPVEKYRLSHLFLEFPPDADEAARQKVEERALDLLLEIQSGADFSEMVKKYSQDEATRRHGGDMGVLEQGSFSEKFEEVIRNLEQGDVSMPVRSDSGVHIFLLKDKTDARSLLFRKRYMEERQELLEELRDKASIRILQNNP